MQGAFAGSIGRGLVGCVVAYALVINALLSGILGTERIAQAAAGLIGERCAADARAARHHPAPAGQPDEEHCPLCTLSAGPAMLPVAPSTGIVAVPCTGALSGVADRNPVDGPAHTGPLPRGPPEAMVGA